MLSRFRNNVDLVFYNRLLRCFVLFDLKIGELKHQDIGQMQMYVHYYDRKVKLPEENPTIGIILCRDKNNAVVEMTLPEDNSQIFASKYETVLPSKEALQKLLQEQITDEDGGEDDGSCNSSIRSSRRTRQKPWWMSSLDSLTSRTPT